MALKKGAADTGKGSSLGDYKTRCAEFVAETTADFSGIFIEISFDFTLKRLAGRPFPFYLIGVSTEADSLKN